jgi:hypothetical protein
VNDWGGIKITPKREPPVKLGAKYRVFFNQKRRFFPARFEKIKKFISISDRHLKNSHP